MVSADAYRFNEWLAIWGGIAGRLDGDTGNIALLAGLRI